MSNACGDGAEYFIFDFYDDAVEFVNSAADYLESL